MTRRYRVRGVPGVGRRRDRAPGAGQRHRDERASSEPSVMLRHWLDQTCPTAGIGCACGVVRAAALTARGSVSPAAVAPRASAVATSTAGLYPSTNSAADPCPPDAANTAPP